MRHQFQSFRCMGSHLLNRVGQVYVGTLTASLAWVSLAMNPATAGQLQTVNVAPSATGQSINLLTSQSMSQSMSQATVNAPLADGTYLYGQSPQRDQAGQAYFVFEVTQGKVVGALYMPNSSFDCASGGFNAQELSLTVVNSYDRTTNPFAIALDTTSTVASTTNPSLKQIGLDGFHLLAVADSDRRILNVCKADFQK
jgi:hypothetical protein